MTKSFLHRDKDAQAAPGSTQLSLAPGTASSSLSLQPAGQEEAEGVAELGQAAHRHVDAQRLAAVALRGKAG